MTQNVLVLGASSGIGRAFAHHLASEGCNLVLASRDVEELERVAGDCRVRFGVEAQAVRFDALGVSDHPDFFAQCDSTFEAGLDGVVVCHGDMAEDADARADAAVAERMIAINYTSVVSVLERAAECLERRGAGWLCALGSVAGDRGRPGNYVYGSTKGAVETYLQGLRARLAKRNVRVVTVKPGFVDTGMTYGRPGLFLVAPPERVARDAMRGVGRDRAVVYSPWFWAGIMQIIRLIPDRIFKRLDL